MSENRKMNIIWAAEPSSNEPNLYGHFFHRDNVMATGMSGSKNVTFEDIKEEVLRREERQEPIDLVVVDGYYAEMGILDNIFEVVDHLVPVVVRDISEGGPALEEAYKAMGARGVVQGLMYPEQMRAKFRQATDAEVVEA